MGKVNWFKGYLQEIEDQVNGINRNRLVIDDSQLVNYLSDHQTTQNCIAIGVLPDFGSNATNPDHYKLKATTQIMVLKKTSYSDVNYDQFFDIFEETYLLAEEIVKKLILDSRSGCNNLRFLNAASIQIVPVWKKADCNGWNILFNFDIDI